MRRVARAGFPKAFVGRAILPEWWDEACEEDPALVQDAEIRIARFFGRPLAEIADPAVSLAAPAYAGARLRRVRDVERDRLGPAIHAGMRIASAVARNMPVPAGAAQVLPASGLQLRSEIKRAGAAPALVEVASALWDRGIPVVPVDVLPAPSFQGMACVVEGGRAVILLGHKHDEPGRAAFFIAHEAGHIAAGDCALGQPVVDADDETGDDAAIERRADLYATQVLVGADRPPGLGKRGQDFKVLARRAAEIESATGADAGSSIFAWARETGDYATAAMAVKALYRNVGAQRTLLRLLSSRVDLGGAPEMDRDLLRCVFGELVPDEAAD